ncbi:hypothetical protein ACJJTC_012730 [Scirpophaga incertulas]
MGVAKNFFDDQFSLQKFGLEHEHCSDFYLCSLQNGRSKLPLFCFRLVLFLGCIGIIITSFVTYDPGVRFWFIFLTNWGVSLITISCGLSFVVSAIAYFKDHIESTFGLPWYVKLDWAVYNMAISMALFITVFYYSFLYGMAQDEEFPVLDLFVHGMNSVVMVALLVTSRTPSHILHFIYPVGFGVCYMLFSIIYYFANGLNPFGNPWIYPMVDWSNPGPTTGIVVACIVFLIVLHTFVVLLSRLRDYLTGMYVRKPYQFEVNE